MLNHVLDAAGIARLVPHAGGMCLLGAILAWDADRISARAASHRDPANPLRRDGTLPAICGVEYALQAMAAHGALTSGAGRQRAGYLASLRGLEMPAATLDDVAEDLLIRAEALTRAATGFVYRFEVTAGDRPLLAGQAAIILPGDPA